MIKTSKEAQFQMRFTDAEVDILLKENISVNA